MNDDFVVVPRAKAREAVFWKTMFLLFVPPLFLSVLVLTHYVHQHQGTIRQNIQLELRP
jgi:hypothetical protein